MVKIYTKVGDHGKTKQVTGKMVPKYDLQISALGSLDELESWIGYVISVLSPKTQELAPKLKQMQRNLYELQADITVKRHHNITAETTKALEDEIDNISTKFPRIKPSSFLVVSRPVRPFNTPVHWLERLNAKSLN